MENELPVTSRPFTNEDALNLLIRTMKADTNLISDGYHCFGELYDHRIALFIALCAQIHDTNTFEDKPVWRTKVEDGWFILGIETARGKQITYHLPESKWHDTEFARDVTKDEYLFDGHTPADVLERLKQL